MTITCHYMWPIEIFRFMYIWNPDIYLQVILVYTGIYQYIPVYTEDIAVYTMLVYDGR